jgi:hypothetical protein
MLLFVSPDGSFRKSANPMGKIGAQRVVPVATGGGLIQWGAYSSLDGGLTWRDPGPGVMSFYAMAIFPDGRELGGVYSETIMLSDDSGLTWKNTHPSANYGHSTDIAAMSGGWALAASQLDILLGSTDRGSTWKAIGNGTAVRATLLAEDPRGGRAWALYAPNRSMQTLNALRREGDSITIATLPTPAFPDSAATALAITARADSSQRLWLGTWGEGIFTSDDGGATWAAHNGELPDLHVDALAVAPNGKIWALTREGLYSEIPVTVSLSHGVKARPARRDPGAQALPLFRSENGDEAGSYFRIDGRKASPSLPLPN